MAASSKSSGSARPTAAAKKSAPPKKATAKQPAKKAVAKQPAVKVTAEPQPATPGQAQSAFERSGAGRIPHKHRDERIADGLMARTRVAPGRLGEYVTSPTRTNPVELIVSQESTRLANLLPVRHARMAQSSFAFYRGTALLMAQDLGAQPSPLIPAQIGGDAHLSNFGFYAAEDRRLVFDMNDFDETRSGPFEWDLKRYATSVLLAARANGVDSDLAERAVLFFIRRYVWWIREFANKPSLEIWYDRLDVQNFVTQLANASVADLEVMLSYLEGSATNADDHSLSDAAKAAAAQRPTSKKAESKGAAAKGKDKKGGKTEKASAEALRDLYVQGAKTVLKRASKKTGLQAVASLTELDSNGRRQFIDNPPLIERLTSAYTGGQFQVDGEAMVDMLRTIFRQYRASMVEEKRVLIDRYAYRDSALKVVGVGSVGTRAAILLMEGQGNPDPFILQIKEAGQSVLTPYLPAEFKAPHLPNPKEMGKRVVLGQRLMQATSDIFLGWVSGITGPAGFKADCKN